MLKEVTDDGLENGARIVMIRQLRRNLRNCRKVLLGEKLDLKTRERWTQLYNSTSTILNRVLKDRQMRDWERRMRIIEEHDNEQNETLEEKWTRKGLERKRQEAADSNETENQADDSPTEQSAV